MQSCGKAEVGQIFRSFSLKSPAIRLKRSKNLPQTDFPSLRSVKSDRLLGRVARSKTHQHPLRAGERANGPQNTQSSQRKAPILICFLCVLRGPNVLYAFSQIPGATGKSLSCRLHMDVRVPRVHGCTGAAAAHGCTRAAAALEPTYGAASLRSGCSVV